MSTDSEPSPSQTTPSPAPRFMDLWGHFIWMTPVCVLCTVFTGQWQFINTFAGIELVQFIIHIKKHHPDHPFMTSRLVRFLVTAPIFATAVYIHVTGYATLIEIDKKLEMFALIISQIGISEMIHEYIHAKAQGKTDTGPAISGIMVFVGTMLIVGVFSWYS